METPAPGSTAPPPAAAPPPAQPSAPPHPPPSSAPSTSDAPPPASSSAPSSPGPAQNPPTPPQPPPPPQSQPQTQPQVLQPQQRPPIPRTRPQSPYPPFSQPLTSPTPTPASSSAASPLPTPSPSLSTMPRGGLALGVPAHPRPPQPPATISPFSPQFSPMSRSSEQSPVSNTQVRQPITGIHSIGMFASLSTGSHLRPIGLPAQHQQRPSQPTLRTASTSANQSLSSQKFNTHGLSRSPSMASPSSPSPVPQSPQPLQQHLTSAQGKQLHTSSLPSSHRPPMKSQALQQRPHHLQPHHQSLMMISHQQQTPSSQQQQQQKHQQQSQQQQQSSLPHQSQEHHSQQYLQLRNQQSTSQQQQAARAHSSTVPKSNVQSLVQSSVVQSGVVNPIVSTDAAESGNQILGKRSIRELVSQIDPSEKLDPEVEDALAEIADDFIESVTTFACSLAKHRKSKTLEAKDILLHVERNWNMTLPGFGGDEIKFYKKQSTNDIHKERLAMIKKSMIGTSDAGNAKNPPAGQAVTNSRTHATKAPMTSSQAERAS